MTNATQTRPVWATKSRFYKTMRAVWKRRAIYTLMIPGLVWYLLFAYFPMGGLSLAFKEYKANLGIWMSPWIGMENFHYVFRDPAFLSAVWRTIVINFGRMLFEFPFPVLLALLLNELRMPKFKKIAQCIFTFPHFLSWVVLSAVLSNFLAYDGMVNSIVTLCGGEAINFLGSEKMFQPMLYLTNVWKQGGWNVIVYLAAISGIDQDQYEAAEIDGATRWQRMLYITLPNLMGTVTVMFILQMGNLMTAGFDQIFNLNNPAVQRVSETLDMYIYRISFQGAADFGFSTAVSLFRSIINMILLVCADRGSKLLGGSGLFG